MLASPGHSPRLIVPPSPSPSVQSLDGVVATTSGRAIMGPPPPGKPRKSSHAVLDEDTYVAAIERIVERDFFPDIPKLQNKLEWLEAVRSGDPVLMREAQLNIIQRLRGIGPSGKDGTPLFHTGTFATPGSVMPTPGFATPSTTAGAPSSSSSLVDEQGTVINTSVSLDEFMRRYTSEDNESFSKIIEKVNRRREEKFKFLAISSSSQPLQLTDKDRQTDGYGTSNQPISTLDTWSYTPKNLLMYDSTQRDDAPLTEAEKEERLHGPPKSVNLRSTRFHEKIFDAKLPEEESFSMLYTPAHHGSSTPLDSATRRRYDLEELRKTPQLGDNAKPPPKAGTAGYSYVSTPSPAPGVDSSPFVTWGEIEGTPLRLEMEDTPVGIGGSGDGPHFKIPAPPVRDTRAHSLSREASRNIRERTKIRHAPYSTPSPARGAAMGSPGRGYFSDAAQRLVNKTIARTCASVDAKLRASYGASTTPGTPRMARNAVRNSREGSLPPESPRLMRSPSVGR
ncbi:hypothetical protein SELMODRAFT_116099 [Selaginella moellendorffii]|uniref:Protein DGCR14 n=1 Tax=Selaginella moellendorffii TaxID=88036 RepID=D8SG84_SELML|nr:splicing factor ESS-2 homolog [Selaginella moellendorffii]EFJ16645.1 hypothetical protein SELMODRAFT_116099 [Selaginella moellendorffii]|eukprot:XP_002982400.1 splicing factor ESS-2 homolog [Selaginella moellendorffii]